MKFKPNVNGRALSIGKPVFPGKAAEPEPSFRRSTMPKKPFRVSKSQWKKLATNKPVLDYPQINPAIVQALKNTGVRFSDLKQDWIDSYKTEAVKNRKDLLQMALSSMAQIEALRKANDNLAYDYGMPYVVNFDEAVAAIMKVLSLKIVDLFTGNSLPANVREKMMELYAEQLFSVQEKALGKYKVAPTHSPFKMSNMNQPVNTPIKSMRFEDSLPPAGRSGFGLEL